MTVNAMKKPEAKNLKGHAYDQRNKSGVAAPPDWSDDSDFAPGEFVEQAPKKPRGKGQGGRRSDAIKTRGRRRSGKEKEAVYDDYKPGAKRIGSKEVKRKHVVLAAENPLLEFFDIDPLLAVESSDSSDDALHPDADNEGEEEEEEEEDNDDSSSRPPSPHWPKPRGSATPSAAVAGPSTLVPNRNIETVRPPNTQEEDSVTEPESDVELPPPTQTQHSSPPNLKRKSIYSSPEISSVPIKRARFETAEDEDSVTESESELDKLHTALLANATNPSRTKAGRDDSDEDSVTESESDTDDDEIDNTLRTRLPDLKDALILSPPALNPPIYVPSKLSTKLRAYQIEGVQFLFRNYSENRGVLIGDDMGLGKTLQVIAFLSAIMQKTGSGALDKDRRKKYVSKLQDGAQWKRERKLPPADAKWATALIVTPSSVMDVWTREFEKWGHFEVAKYHGKERDQVLRDFTLGRLDVVVTSFDTARKYGDLLDSLPWTVVIVDEAHKIKNQQAKLTQALYAWKWREDHPIPPYITRLTDAINAAHASEVAKSSASTAAPTTALTSTPTTSQDTSKGKVGSSDKTKSGTGTLAPIRQRTGPINIALTGTAIQNDYMELWTLLDWCNPGMVGSKSQWKMAIVEPLTRGQAKGSTPEERLKGQSVALRLRDGLLPRFFIRRTKDIISDQLPKKIDEVVFCPLTKMQTEVYKRILALPAVQNMIKKDEPCDCGSRIPRKKCCYPWDKKDLFTYMSTLIKVSNHVALILPAPGDTADQVVRNKELTSLVFREMEPPKYGTAMLEAGLCGKWKVLHSLLVQWKRENTAMKNAKAWHKVLIFTKSVKLLNMLEFHLNSEGWGFLTLDGSVKQADRMPMIDKFHEDKNVFVFLISTLAGGTGLNLTGADKVVIFDPNWNPAHDLQAMDRAYRFGQTRDVHVYRLLGCGSLEELIYDRQIYKQQQMAIGYTASHQNRYFSGVSGDKQRQGELFGLKNIFKLEDKEMKTKIAIDQALLNNFDWALAHMEVAKSKTTERRKSGSQGEIDEVYEVEMSQPKEDDLKGLGAFMLDDDLAPEVQEDEITKILNNHGIKYTHHNNDILAPSHIEEAQIETAIKEKKERTKRAKQSKKKKSNDATTPDEPPKPVWPPVRRHHKREPAPPTPAELREKRHLALIELGYVQDMDGANKLAEKFNRPEYAEEVNEILAAVDEHLKKSRCF